MQRPTSDADYRGGVELAVPSCDTVMVAFSRAGPPCRQQK
eukprot:IDg12463t1